MAQVSFQSGLGEVLRATQAQLEKAAEIIGGMAESYAKQACPVDTGNLRNSITHTTEDNGHTVVIGSAVEYAPYVELGTGQRYPGNAGAGVVKWMAPRPYLRPAIENHKDEYREVVKSEMSR